MEDYLYFEWDYDRGILTQYRRIGQCNNCGDCCKSLIEFVAHPDMLPDADNNYPDSRDGGNYTDETGVWNQVTNAKGETRYFRINRIEEVGTHKPCCALDTQGNKCTIHFEKNLLCKVYPMSPKQTAPFKNCSYTFEVEAVWDLDAAPFAAPAI